MPPRRQRAEPTQPEYREKPNDIRSSSLLAPMGNQTVDMMLHTAGFQTHLNTKGEKQGKEEVIILCSVPPSVWLSSLSLWTGTTCLISQEAKEPDRS